MQKLQIHTVVSHMFGQNTFLVGCEGRNDCVVVDPGFEAESIQQTLQDKRLTPKAILNTHGHVDHIAGNEFLKRCWPDCPLVIGADEADKLNDPSANLSAQFGAGVTSPPADHLVREGDCYEAAGLKLHVLEIPGHSRGHVVYLCKEGDPWVLLGGDVLFQGSIGRTDFPDGNTEQLLSSIRSKLFVLPESTVVLPGHGASTTIGIERTSNPYVGGE